MLQKIKRFMLLFCYKTKGSFLKANGNFQIELYLNYSNCLYDG